MFKKILILLSFSFLSLYSFSQTVSENIEKAAKDPKTKENAAKADVYVADKKIISNDSRHPKDQVLVITSKKKKEKASKRRCNKS